MSHHRLNLEALRADRIPRLVHPTSPLPDRHEASEERAFTRRGLLGMATLTALGLSPSIRLMNNLAHAATDSLTWDVSETRVVFRLGGKDRWIIDLASFSGNPRLVVRKQEGCFLVHLADAFFPGTSLPADFICELRQGAFSWNMLLSFKLGGFKAYAPFERWLLGQESAGSAVTCNTPVCGMGLDGQLHLQGEGTATFKPNWSFDFKGHSLVAFRGRAGDLSSNVLHLALLDDHAPSLATKAEKVRTLLAMERGSQHWEFSPAFTTSGPSHVVYRRNGFETIHFETWEDSAGTSVCGILAEGPAPESSVWFHPHSPNMEGNAIPEPIAFPLAYIQYARLFSNQEQEREEILRGRFVSAPSSVRVLGCALEVGGRPTTPPFELLNQDGTIQACCEPEVYRVAVPLGGAVVEPIELPHGTRLVWDGQKDASIIPVQTNPRLKKRPLMRPIPKPTVPQQEKAIQQIPAPGIKKIVPNAPISPEQIRPEIVAPGRIFTDFRSLLEVHGPFTVSVLRPEDLLVLKFEFKNLTLQAKPGQPPVLVRSEGRSNPSMTVHLPPQNIGEQAFFEASKDCKQPSRILTPKRGAPGAKEFAEEQNPVNGEQIKFPIQAGIAGWSRLVFLVPGDVGSLAYSLKDLSAGPGTTLPGLLDWNRLTPIVSPAAAPPPPPPRPFLPEIQINPNQRITPKLPQGKFPKIVPRSVPESEKPMPQSVPVDPRLVAPIWQVGYREAHPFLLARAVFLREAYRHRTQLRKQLPSQQIQPNIQIQPKPIQPSPIQPNGRMPVQPGDISIAKIPPRPPSKEHLPNFTAIEAPFRVFLSPNRMGGWAHTQSPVELNGRHELWHSRLGVKRQDSQKEWFIDERNEWYRTMRAIWSPDYDADPGKWPHFSAGTPHPRNPFRMSLDAKDRNELVHLMADSTVDAKWPSRVAKVDRFMLTSLGAWMDLRYAADVPLNTPLTVEEWRHRATMGRDHFVRVVYKGCLFPFGHRVSLVKVTERKFEQVDEKYVAGLRQRMFIVVREPEKSFPALGQNSAPSHGRSFPFRIVRCRTLITPNLDDPTLPPSVIDPGKPQEVFWPHVCGSLFQFQFTGIDHDGKETEFSVPCAFLANNLCFPKDNWLTENVRDLDGPDKPDRNDGKDGLQPFYLPYFSDPSRKTAGPSLAVMGGQKIAYAPMQSGMDTVLETVSLIFGAEFPGNTRGLVEAGQPFFYPVLHRSVVRVPAIQQIIGDATPITVRYAQRYKDLEWNPNGNAGSIYLQLIDPLTLNFPSDKSGGLATPNVDITSLSARKGPVGGDLNTFAQGNFDPQKFFNKAKDENDAEGGMKQARFLGGIPLGDIIQAGPSSDAPEMITERSGSGGAGGIGTRAAEEVISTKYKYETTKLKKDPLNLFVPNPSPPVENKPSKLILNTRIDLKFAQGQSPEPQFNIDGKVNNFELNLFKMILVRFKSFAFKKLHGKDLDVSPDIDDVKFGGPLAFVQKLADAVGGNSENDSAHFLPVPSGTPRVLPAKLYLTAGAGGGGGCKGKLDFKFLKSFSPAKVSAGFLLCIPDLTLGALTIDNMSVKVVAELKLLSLIMGTGKDFNWDTFKKEFDKAFTVALAFSTRQSPFHLIVYIFGGGGFLGLKLGASGLQVLEASIEFGAQAKLDLGVASGAVHVFAGIYFKLEKKSIQACGGTVETMSILLEGYVRMGGHVNVLGIITITVEFKLSLQYISEGGVSKLAGEASLVVKVEVLFFSASVTLKVRKEFAGSGGGGVETCALDQDGNQFAARGFGVFRTQNRRVNTVLPPPPKIIDLVAKPEWERYVAAFAAD